MRQDVTRTLALAGRVREIAPYEPFQNQFRRFEFGRIPSGWTSCGPQPVTLNVYVLNQFAARGATPIATLNITDSPPFKQVASQSASHRDDRIPRAPLSHARQITFKAQVRDTVRAYR